jgi:LysR family glycine cleavage system transcriptional activator
MNSPRRRPLSLAGLRAFEAVARRLAFGGAADELHLTQSAVSRQIKGLEDELGAQLFSSGTRHVDLTVEGTALLRAVAPSLDRVDAAVRQIRQTRGRRVVSVSTFASFASLWLIPRLAAFQQAHPDIDIRIGADDAFVEPGASDFDVALRHCRPDQARAGAVRLFGGQITPVASPWLLEHAKKSGVPLKQPADLAQHTLLEENGSLPSGEYLSWRHWLAAHGLAELQPARWLYFDYTHQQVQAALAGQGVTLTRLALTAESLARGELIELFGKARLATPYAYWLIAPPQPGRPELERFAVWVLAQARATRIAIGEPADDAPLPQPVRA